MTVPSELAVVLADGATAAWLSWVEAALWRGTAALLVAIVADHLFRRRLWPQVLAALWGAAFLLHLLPPLPASPLGLLPAVDAGRAGRATAGLDVGLGSPAAGASIATAGLEPVPATGMAGASSGIASPWMLMGAWIAGMLLLASIGRRRRRRDQARLRAGRLAPPGRLLRIHRRARGRFDRGQSGLLRWLPEPRLMLTDTAEVPAAVGALRPVIVLPTRLVDRLDDRELEHVLVHELAHVQRGDLLVQGLIAGLHLLFWFQPLLIWARRRAHACREICCDATAAKVLADDTGAYRTTLLRLALEYGARSASGATGLLAGVIVHRVEWLEAPRHGTGPARVARVLAMAVLLLTPALLAPAAPGPDDDAAARARGRVEAALEEGSSLRLRYAVMQLRDARERVAAERGTSTPRTGNEDGREGEK